VPCVSARLELHCPVLSPTAEGRAPGEDAAGGKGGLQWAHRRWFGSQRAAEGFAGSQREYMWNPPKKPKTGIKSRAGKALGARAHQGRRRAPLSWPYAAPRVKSNGTGPARPRRSARGQHPSPSLHDPTRSQKLAAGVKVTWIWFIAGLSAD